MHGTIEYHKVEKMGLPKRREGKNSYHVRIKTLERVTKSDGIKTDGLLA